MVPIVLSSILCQPSGQITQTNIGRYPFKQIGFLKSEWRVGIDHGGGSEMFGIPAYLGQREELGRLWDRDRIGTDGRHHSREE